MKSVLLCGFAAMLMVGPQNGQPEPFPAFAGRRTSAVTGPYTSCNFVFPLAWIAVFRLEICGVHSELVFLKTKWVPDVKCQESVKAVTECKYIDTISVDAAKKAPLPERCVSAFIPVGAGYHVYSARFGWTFFASS
ncbi:MAG: hypothetical protein WB952_26240 [Terriglobales bacterium]